MNHTLIKAYLRQNPNATFSDYKQFIRTRGEKMAKPRIEFLYNKQADKTVVYVWKGMSILHTETIDKDLTKEEKNTISNKLLKEYNKEPK